MTLKRVEIPEEQFAFMAKCRIEALLIEAKVAAAQAGQLDDTEFGLMVDLEYEGGPAWRVFRQHGEDQWSQPAVGYDPEKRQLIERLFIEAHREVFGLDTKTFS